MSKTVLLIVAAFCAKVAVIEADDAYTISGFNSITWPGGVVPYTVDDAFQPYEKDRINTTIRDLNSSSFCVSFRPKTTRDINYVQFVKSDGKCASQWIGYTSGGAQKIYLAANCSTPRYIYFVLLQALGLPAEHMRPDRDNFVNIYWGNVTNGYQQDFKKFAFIDPRIMKIPYDLFSRLHYPNDKWAKATGLLTIVATSDSKLQLGNIVAPSSLDYQKLAALYCPGGKVQTTTPPPATTTEVTIIPPFTEPDWSGSGSGNDLPPFFSTEATDNPNGLSTEPVPLSNPSGINANLARLRGISMKNDSRNQTSSQSNNRHKVQSSNKKPRASPAKVCSCLERPYKGNSCTDQYSFGFQNMAAKCRTYDPHHKPDVCFCDDVSYNPCQCSFDKRQNKCVKLCQTRT